MTVPGHLAENGYKIRKFPAYIEIKQRLRPIPAVIRAITGTDGVDGSEICVGDGNG